MTLLQKISKCVVNLCFEALKVLLVLFLAISTTRLLLKVTPITFFSLNVTVREARALGMILFVVGWEELPSGLTYTYKSALSLVCN